LVLHWALAAGGKSLSLAMQVGGAAAGGWVAVAWSPDGSMPGSDAVIGGLPGGAVKAYAISGYSEADVRPSSRFSIGSASSANGGSLIKFSRSSGDGAVPVSLTGSNSIIWAFSSDQSPTLANHGGNYGQASVDFSCTGNGDYHERDYNGDYSAGDYADYGTAGSGGSAAIAQQRMAVLWGQFKQWLRSTAGKRGNGLKQTSVGTRKQGVRSKGGVQTALAGHMGTRVRQARNAQRTRANGAQGVNARNRGNGRGAAGLKAAERAHAEHKQVRHGPYAARRAGGGNAGRNP
ncbi:unnamed protein product, partial [Closterium sp. Naga37s-1]